MRALVGMECNVCTLPATHGCARCGQAVYCSARCQAEDWSEHAHRELCMDPARLEPAHVMRVMNACLDHHAEHVDPEDVEHAEYGELLLAHLERAPHDADALSACAEWIQHDVPELSTVGAAGLFRSDEAKQARGLKRQARGLRTERRGTAKANLPKRGALWMKEKGMRGKAAMKKHSGRARKKKKGKKKRGKKK